MPLFHIKYRTRISGLAKIAYQDQHAYIEAKNNREANKAFKAGIRFTRFGMKCMLRNELGTWYSAQPCTEADIVPTREWDPPFPRRPLTVEQVGELFRTYNEQHAAAFPDSRMYTADEYNALALREHNERMKAFSERQRA